jgi:hypothetical protein
MYMISFHIITRQIIVQITKHWSSNLKPEMQLDKVQLVATAAVSSAVKVQWLQWWNSNSLWREALRFPKSGFMDKEFEVWLNKAAFWAGVRHKSPPDRTMLGHLLRQRRTPLSHNVGAEVPLAGGLILLQQAHPRSKDVCCGNTDSNFFALRPQISTKTGSLRFGNK